METACITAIVILIAAIIYLLIKIRSLIMNIIVLEEWQIEKHIPKFSELEISDAKVKIAIKKRLNRKYHAKGIDNYIDEL